MWLAINKSSSNSNKTVFMTFRNHADSVPDYIDISIDGKIRNRVGSAKYLGIIFDFNMK